MKRTRSFLEGQDSMVALSGPLASEQQLQEDGASMALICLSQTDLSLASSKGPRSGIEKRESPETASSRETLPAEHADEQEGKQVLYSEDSKKKADCLRPTDEGLEQIVVQRFGNLGRPTLKEIACEPIEIVVARLDGQPDKICEELKGELREILNGTGGAQQREEFAMLQKWVLSRQDLSPETLMVANRTQLEILVAIKTGIQAFLHPEVSVTQSVLIEVFFYQRCRNMACQNQLPGEDCGCEVCSTKNGFCNACMCTICSKFDFDVNTCRWIGCDVCSHWTHTDCAIRVGQIAMGVSLKGGSGASEMLFKCKACKHTSELLGWVKDVFHTCAGDWQREELMKEFDSVRRIFHGSEDSKGRRLFWKSEELLERLNNEADGITVCSEMQQFFQELEAEDVRHCEDAKTIEPLEACNRIAEVVQEAVSKMEAVAEEKARTLKKTRLALETCEKELEEKTLELRELQVERDRKKQQLEELETIVRVKLAEAEMFQKRAEEALKEAEELKRTVAAKAEKIEQEYTARYLELRLNEVEAQRRGLFEKIQLQEYSCLQPDASQMLVMCKIQDLIKRVCTSKKDAADSKETSGSAI